MAHYNRTQKMVACLRLLTPKFYKHQRPKSLRIKLSFLQYHDTISVFKKNSTCLCKCTILISSDASSYSLSPKSLYLQVIFLL